MTQKCRAIPPTLDSPSLHRHWAVPLRIPVQTKTLPQIIEDIQRGLENATGLFNETTFAYNNVITSTIVTDNASYTWPPANAVMNAHVWQCDMCAVWC